jgi:hypothetical protein
MSQNKNTPAEPPVCKICRKPIEIGARKCTECDSFQDWRRHFSIGTVVLSLLIALISVTTTGFQVVHDLLAKEQSDIRFSLVRYGPDSIKIMGSNLGDRAGALRSATLNIKSNNKVKNTYNLVWEDVELVIKPGSWRLFSMQPAIENTPIKLIQVASVPGECRHSIKFEVLAFDHNPKSFSIEYSCPSL